KPHGIAANPAFDTFYITGQSGNFIYRMPVDKKEEQVSIDGNAISKSPSRDPHEIMMHPDNSKYFLTCETSDEIRVIERSTNKILDSIAVGKKPQEMAISKKLPYLFVSCQEDVISSGLFKGSVYV